MNAMILIIKDCEGYFQKCVGWHVLITLSIVPSLIWKVMESIGVPIVSIFQKGNPNSWCIALPGYFKNPEATKNTVDDEGWLRTGDVGYIDDDGDVFIVERVKELIKYKGFQVSSRAHKSAERWGLRHLEAISVFCVESLQWSSLEQEKLPEENCFVVVTPRPPKQKRSYPYIQLYFLY